MAGAKAAGQAQQEKAQKTVSKAFSEQLEKLMARLKATDHRYIRCLKPNHVLKGGVWDHDLMLRQLSYSGTLEVCKVRKAGLNVRKPLKEFYHRYRIISPDIDALGGTQDLRKCVSKLMDQLAEQLGELATIPLRKTLMLMHDNTIIDRLEDLHKLKQKVYARTLQACTGREAARSSRINDAASIWCSTSSALRTCIGYAEVRKASFSIEYWWKHAFLRVIAKRQ